MPIESNPSAEVEAGVAVGAVYGAVVLGLAISEEVVANFDSKTLNTTAVNNTTYTVEVALVQIGLEYENNQFSQFSLGAGVMAGLGPGLNTSV